ncbi:MAG: hypothetical protein GY754_07510 [bacterium]|nr:hypothetical protein [bacterium]
MKKSSFVSLEGVPEIDQYIFQDEDIYHWDKKKIESVQYHLIKESVMHHYDHCPDYRAYCEKTGFIPSQITSFADLKLVPLIPTLIFKKRDILSVNEEDIEKNCMSSGTEGSTSTIYRDKKTLDRFLGTVDASVDQLFDLSEAIVFNLGPSTEEAKDLWFSYVMSITDIIFPTVNFVTGDTFYPEQVIEKLNKYRQNFKTLVITGAPVMYLQLFEYMKKEGISIPFGEQVFVVSAGGWKLFSGNAIPRNELINTIQYYFKGFQKNNFRDVFNMVELNSIIPECEHWVKHVQPWIKVLIIDPWTGLEITEKNKTGILAFLDPTPSSFPCFILSTDFGQIIHQDDCPCGRSGTGIKIVGRINRTDSRGCALKIDKKYSAR